MGAPLQSPARIPERHFTFRLIAFGCRRLASILLSRHRRPTPAMTM